MILAEDDHISEVLNTAIYKKEQLKQEFLNKKRKQENLEKYNERRKRIKFIHQAKPQFEELTCPICLEIFQKVIIVPCGHAFCEKCLFESLIRKQECPVCRVKIKTHTFQYCESFDNRILQLINNYGNEKEKEHFKKRELETEEWNNSKSLNNLAQGQKVDVMDLSFVWCVGEVLRVTQKEVFIHYEGWGEEYDEFIPLKSHRVAPFGLYTGREDIPKYSQNQQFD